MPHRLLDRISNKREMLARGLGALGVFSLLERMTVHSPILAVFTYHRIAVPGIASNLYYDPVVSATPEVFETQLRLLTTRFHVVDLQTLVDLAAGDDGPVAKILARGGKPWALITFDDGYQDNYTTALPILRKLGVPATFFLVSSFLTEAPLPWWDHVACVIKQTRVPRLVLRRQPADADPAVIDLGQDPDAVQRKAAIAAVIGWFLHGAITDEPWFLSHLEAQAEVPVDRARLGRELFMDLDQVKQLAQTNMAIGSHSQSHQALGSLDDAAQRHELVTSKQFLESTLGKPIQALAYPFGWAGSFSGRTMQLAGEAGYRLAFSALEGVNRPGTTAFQPLSLHRLNVGTGDSAPLLRARAALHGALGKSIL